MNLYGIIAWFSTMTTIGNCLSDTGAVVVEEDGTVRLECPISTGLPIYWRVYRKITNSGPYPE